MKKDSHSKVKTAILALACLGLAFSQAAAQDIEACLACHQDQNLARQDASGKVHSLYVDKEKFLKSTHAEFACVDCHEGVEAKNHPAGGIPDISCANCHDEEAEKYLASNHGRLAADGNPNAPACHDCHSMHAVMKADNPEATINAANLSVTCGACHEEQAKAALVPTIINFAKGEEPASSLTPAFLASQIATRVKGHGKDNLAYAYETKNCGNCHIDPINHGPEPAETAVCYSCHSHQKPGIIFGKVHKVNVVLNPFLSVLLAMGYIAALAGLVCFFRPGSCKKTDCAEPPAEG